MALHGDNEIDDLLAMMGGGEEATSSSATTSKSLTLTNQSLSKPSEKKVKKQRKKKKKKRNKKDRIHNNISFAETRLSQSCFHWPSSSSIDGTRFLFLGAGLVHDCKGYTCNDQQHIQSSYGASMCQSCGKSAATHEFCISSSSVAGDNYDDDLTKKCHPLSILSVANIIVSSRNIRCLISEHYPEAGQKNALIPPLNSIAIIPKEISNALDVHTGRILITLKKMQNEILNPSNKHQYQDIQKEFKTLGSIASISRNGIEILQEKTTILISCMQAYKKANGNASSINVLEKRLSAIISCDAIYYGCYYSAIISPCVTDKDVNGSVIASVIPHPPTYFSCPGLSWDVNSGLESLRIFLGQSSTNKDLTAPLDESTKHMLLKSWGLEDRLSSNAETTSRQHKAILNPLLALWQSRFLETIRHVWCTRYSKIQSPRALLGTTNTSINNAGDVLKLHETAAISSEVSLWRDSVRDYPANFYAYASPTDKALQVISNCMDSLEVKQILETGAGTGYWSSLINAKLSKRRLETEGQANVPLVVAYDISPPSSEESGTAASSNEYHGNVPTFMYVQKADAHDSTRTNNAKTALLLCYPPPDSDMAYNALTAHINKGGHIVIHIGEWKGLTGNALFEELLKQQFYCDEKDLVQLPVWGTDATYLTIWRKKVNGENTAAFSCSSAIGYCSSENCSKQARRRCRYARCLQYCSFGCYQSHSSKRKSILALHMICVGQEELLNYEDDKHFLDLSEIFPVKRDTTAHDDSDRPRKKRKKKKRHQYSRLN